MGKWKSNGGFRMTVESKLKHKGIGGASFEELLNLAKTQRLETTDEWKEAKRRLRHE